MRKNSSLWAVAALSALFMVPLAWGVEFPANVRDALAQYEADMRAVAEAYAQRDAASVQERQASAEAHLDRAIELLAENSALESDAPEILKLYADAHAMRGNTDLSAEALQRAVEISQEDAALWLALGRALSDLGPGRAEDAQAALVRALELGNAADGKANAHAALGRLYRRQGLYDLASESYTEAVALAPDHMAARSALAVLKIRTGHIREAADELEALNERAPELQGQTNALIAEYLLDFKRRRLHVPDTKGDHMALARLYLRIGMFPDALPPLERAAKLEQDDYIVWNMIGSISAQLGRETRAREAFGKSLALNPDQPRTVEALADLGGAPTENTP